MIATTGRHLAQLNIARLAWPLDDPRVADFAGNLERVNGIADRSPGFVWRLKDEGGDATGIEWDAADPRTIVNMSVWTDVASLEGFVWNTVHRQFYARRAEWFELLEEQYFVMWTVAPGHRPSLDEARERLLHLRRHGPTEHAFGWESLGESALRHEARCA